MSQHRGRNAFYEQTRSDLRRTLDWSGPRHACHTRCPLNIVPTECISCIFPHVLLTIIWTTITPVPPSYNHTIPAMNLACITCLQTWPSWMSRDEHVAAKSHQAPKFGCDTCDC
ncbi:hypothetical protein BDP55DRAFT_328868 [Colletotrichum godetiae]|uniref:Uncharacterized protein n=1 Tax=Colletotrichum godetiae TaxID=1209918 RepID=A0AAJ0EQU1_9PEZI|nr:uncharacterized protein BDP55DRAFT_328868 [Colletotrichum godetiae]KAK1659882.1 hypothetical protein BDP55DRAFT_328868 [Colletotrichum godetiae]